MADFLNMFSGNTSPLKSVLDENLIKQVSETTTPMTTGNNDWLSKWFGNSEQAGIVNVGTSALSGIMQGWLGYEQLQLAQENTALQKQAYADNKAKSDAEIALKLDAQKRGLAHHGVSSATLDKYAKQYS